jgi:hypothetical protein
MDPCRQLRYDIRDACAERDRELDRARRRFWLGLFGLDFVLDWEERTSVDRALAGFLLLVQTGEIVLAVDQLLRILHALARRTGRHAAARTIGGIAGRLLGLAALGLLVLDVLAAHDRWTRSQVAIHRRFRERLEVLRRETTCPDPEAIFREEGVHRS